jgi:hypothetical protein
MITQDMPESRINEVLWGDVAYSALEPDSLG